MPQSAQSPASMGPKASEKIPMLNNIAPSIFVPLQDDFLTIEPPRDRIERLKRILQTIDCQREGVKENLLYMFEREKKRIVLEATEIEEAQGLPDINPGLAPSEVDEIIANMEAPAMPGRDYNVRDMPRPGPAPVPPNASLRDKTVMELLNMVERGLTELEGFEKHMAGIKDRYLICLEQEMARVDDAGKRPEERSGIRRF
ncbi:uncharacterized protein B0H64DRAFT_403904 [Chaetomium fimeti]|uniref:Uncharacterized protein n=1 Tax=Chaetomium fimeti TaxID=1854472 RepID=A0AAE0HB20_9PEZI|nr:hypothetical protein B0H64DRAFT_403904 [Chaetomium fimeti]